MATKKWGQLTPKKFGNLDMDTTLVLLPLGTMGAFNEETRLWDDMRVTEREVQDIVETINALPSGPLKKYTALSLPALWAGVEPGPDLPGAIGLPREIFDGVVGAICNSLKTQGVKYVILVARDDAVHLAAQAVVKQLNQPEEDKPWVMAYQPEPAPMLAAAGIGEVICRALAELLGYDPDMCA